MTNTTRAVNGFLVINKPSGWTSFDVVAKLRTITGIAKIGHAGTLDPFATGVLVVAFNRATLLIDYIQQQKKYYTGRIKLGQISETDDTEGHKTTIPVTNPPDENSVRLTLARMTGTILQLPPRYSALKVKGTRMYDLARQGKHVERKPRTVRIYSLALEHYDYPHISITAEVGAGTYIRALARDIGEDLGTGGYLEQLTRTQVGDLTLNEAHSLSDVSVAGLPGMLYPLSTAVESLPKIILSERELGQLAIGQSITAPNALQKQEADTVAAIDRSGSLRMLISFDRRQNQLKNKKIFDMSLAR